jgi:hypothetical protein
MKPDFYIGWTAWSPEQTILRSRCRYSDRITGGRWRSLFIMRTTKGEKIWSINGWCFGPYVLEL